MELKVREIQAKTILSKTGIPGDDWTVNPYTGCTYGCKYCYAYFVGRFRHPDEEWGTYLDAKINAPELLRKELLNKLKKTKTKDAGSIWFSSVTDPYQGLEAKYQLTRRCIQVLVDHNYTGRISILSKSPLVTRDIDLFKQLLNIEVGITVTSPGDPVTAYLETYAPPHKERIKALQMLHSAGLKTYAFVGPLLPHLVWRKADMKRLFQSLKNAGVDYIFLEHLNLRPYIRERLFGYLKKDHPELIEQYLKAQSPKYRHELDQLVLGLAKDYKLKIAGGSTIHHPEIGSWKKDV